MKKNILLLLCILLISAVAADIKEENKNITIISAHSTADGKTTIGKELLEECIESLPAASDLYASVEAQTKFVREINGEPNKNDFVKLYTASIEINYMLYQKIMMIMSTSSIQAQKPDTEIVEKRVMQSIRFESNSANGDSYANRSRREYYFSTQEAAVEDVKKQAVAWLKQQAAVVCKK